MACKLLIIQGWDLFSRFVTGWRYCGDSGEAERLFGKESERHSGMNPNAIGA